METTTINLTWAEFYAILGGVVAFGLGLSVWMWRVADRQEKAETAQAEQAEQEGVIPSLVDS